MSSSSIRENMRIKDGYCDLYSYYSFKGLLGQVINMFVCNFNLGPEDLNTPQFIFIEINAFKQTST